MVYQQYTNRMAIKCNKCGELKESFLDLHHKVPKWVGGTDKDGRIYLCKDCHRKLHDHLDAEIYKLTKKWIRGEIWF